ncbi:hypothetical protein VTN49DRAFT_6555 [Thermomyces lanuginosus]|uniref:uncharacterized protein n=1 Tax=Thermomyces lanuginosus TaxID=5541 RepID=UPI00374478BD
MVRDRAARDSILALRWLIGLGYCGYVGSIVRRLVIQGSGFPRKVVDRERHLYIVKTGAGDGAAWSGNPPTWPGRTTTKRTLACV